MRKIINARWAERMADRLYLLSPSAPTRLDELRARQRPTGAETSLEAALLARQLQIAGVRARQQ